LRRCAFGPWQTTRRVEPEWLDALPPDDPRAARARRDLGRVNALMLQSTIMARALVAHAGIAKPGLLIDLGSGDGIFMLRIARRLASRWPSVSVILLDRQDIVSDETRQEFRAVGWSAETVAADVHEFLEQAAPPADVITANLFLHHFPDEALRRLLALAAKRTDAFIACEPRRARLALAASRLLWAIGCNDVTRHDAVASVRAGFNDSELSGLWPAGGEWTLREWSAMPFSHCFSARRGRSSPP
jgi:hypothetical protein